MGWQRCCIKLLQEHGHEDSENNNGNCVVQVILMEKILKVNCVNDYVRYIGAKRGLTLLSVLSLS